MALPITCLSLDEFRASIGLMPWWFFGLSNSDTLRMSAQCPQVTRRYAWQNDGIAGRYELLEAIQSAEEKLQRYLGYRVGPTYREAVVPWPRLGDARQSRLAPVDAIGRWLSLDLPEGHVIAVGTETRTLVRANAAVVLSDPDGDTVDELFTVGPYATTVTDPAEIAIYFASTDILAGDTLDESYRIRPVSVSIAGGQVTIRGASWLLVRPINEERPVTRDVQLDPARPGILATSVDIYQRTTVQGATTDTAGGLLTWETRPCHGAWCCCSGCSGSASDPASAATALARVGLRNARLGLVAPADAIYDQTAGVWSSDCCGWCDEPDRATIRYLAGLPSPDGQRIDPEVRTVVARLAAAEMGRPICACDDANRELYRWQFDLSRADAAGESYQISPDMLDNPIGTRRGQVEAWRFILRKQQTRGLSAG